jgi:hypothetical protein
VLKGIFISDGKSIKITLPFVSGKITYRAIWCNARLDGNLDILLGPVEEISVAKEITISAEHCSEKYDSMLFEVLSYNSAGEKEKEVSLLSPIPAGITGTPLLVREAFLMNEEEWVIQQLVNSQEPIVIWCAGLRTLQMLSNTSLGRANIKMIIDGDPSRKGQLFCGRIIHSPEDIGDFNGKIVVIHASSPEQVESQIRRGGIVNEILIL